ncbi:hypothetical protein QWY87_10265 [Lutimonas halocynthiae]|uniref:Arm DNA-binding domain-containing protein n=1 Tax=Lutimonas halocynthiae TaxID=1446477 RepID=UPI0025B554EA|nr:hypothetical protein [Lutimonas halocynthiae]MDN3643087.1 hypothetical protein [Lutimonas halocynthiae]
MTTFKLHIRFNLVMARTNKKGFSSVKCRLTYNKNRKDFSTGITVNPDHWDPKKQRLLDQSDQEETIEHPDGRTYIGYRTGNFLARQAMKKSGKSILELSNLMPKEIIKLAGY